MIDAKNVSLSSGIDLESALKTFSNKLDMMRGNKLILTCGYIDSSSEIGTNSNYPDSNLKFSSISTSYYSGFHLDTDGILHLTPDTCDSFIIIFSMVFSVNWTVTPTIPRAMYLMPYYHSTIDDSWTAYLTESQKTQMPLPLTSNYINKNMFLTFTTMNRITPPAAYDMWKWKVSTGAPTAHATVDWSSNRSYVAVLGSPKGFN